MCAESVWIELASFDAGHRCWQRRKLRLARAAVGAGSSLATGASVVLHLLVPEVGAQPLLVSGMVMSQEEGQVLVEGDPHASTALVEALPKLADYGFFALVPFAAFD